MTDDAAVVVRPFRDGDVEAFLGVDQRAFGYTDAPGPNPETAVLDHDRSLIAELDGEPVGVASAFGRRLSVPGGGSAASAGATWVGVLPTHRRRGVLTAMMRRHLDDSARRGDAVSVLWASEPGIYHRFGYGLGTRSLALDVPHATVLHRAPHDPSLRTRILDAPASRPARVAVHDAAAVRRPGAPSRDDTWWQREEHDPEHRRRGASERRYLVAEGPGGPRGYAAYATNPQWDERGVPDGEVWVRELVALDPAARAALWQVLVGHDLMRRVRWNNAPSDEPLLEWVESRGVVRAVRDQLYVRVLDVAAALSARAYAGPLEVVLEIDDALRRDVAGRWRLLVADDGRAIVERTRAEPALRLDVRELGAVYLGARSLLSLARAGLVEVHDAGAVAATSRAFRYEPDAWCPIVF